MTADDNPANQFAAKYDHANLATKLQRGAVINYFIYGPNNAKARQTGSDGSKVYLGGYEDWITAGQTKVSLGNYAQITNGTGGRVLHYFLTDRLGSVDAVTDGNGNLIETRGYDAFGAPRTGVWADASQIASTAITPKGFTSHEHLNSVKLIHMNGRMYDFQLGRFLGVDPFIQMPTNSQSMNPYSYIMNNPLSGTDPTGYVADKKEPEPCPPDTSCDGPPPEEADSNSNKRFDMHSKHQGGSSLRPSVGGKKPNGAPGQSSTPATPSAASVRAGGAASTIGGGAGMATCVAVGMVACPESFGLGCIIAIGCAVVSADIAATGSVELITGQQQQTNLGTLGGFAGLDPESIRTGENIFSALASANGAGYLNAMPSAAPAFSMVRGAESTQRSLTAADLGLAGKIIKLEGTYAVENGVATARVDMIRGQITNPLKIVTNLMNTARASGATSLRIEGTIANETLYKVLAKRYGLSSQGANDVITIPLKGK